MDHFAVRDTDDAVKFTVAGSSVSFVALPDGFCLHIHMAQDAAYTVNGVGLPVIDPVQSGVWVKFQDVRVLFFYLTFCFLLEAFYLFSFGFVICV